MLDTPSLVNEAAAVCEEGAVYGIQYCEFSESLDREKQHGTGKNEADQLYSLSMGDSAARDLAIDLRQSQGHHRGKPRPNRRTGRHQLTLLDWGQYR